MKKSLMSVNGLFATINTPESLKGEDTYGLPPYDECPAFDVDEYPACPANWMHGSDKASSYFVPVEPGRGMWFDFTLNESHSHHVAIVISVQGVNPITGQRVSALNLEKYQNQCPVHKINFQGGRFCPECGYSWPAQNYLATTTREILWIDGFRNESGKVRQYIITEEEIRSVAKALIGDDRVYAIGFAFYLSKNPKPSLTATETPFGQTWGEKLWNKVTNPWFSPSGSGRTSPNVTYGFTPSNQISPSICVGGTQCGAGISQPDAIQINSSSGHYIMMDDNTIPSVINCVAPGQARLRDTNDFIDLSQVPNKQQRYSGYPDDANSLQQLASGDANLDIFYSTQVDENGNEYSLESCDQVPRQDEDYWIPQRCEANEAPAILDPESFCPPGVVAAQQDLRSAHGLNDVAQFKRISMPLKRQVEKKLEIGAGAQIWQDVGVDPENIDFWQAEPAGLIYVNYVSVEKAKEIIAAGKRGSKKDGFLAEVPVGN